LLDSLLQEKMKETVVEDSNGDNNDKVKDSNGDTNDEMPMDEEQNTKVKEEDTEQKLFRSDDFKIEIQNLPKFFGMGQMKKLFNNKLKLNAHKLKPCGPRSTYMYVCFKNEEDKAKAIDVLDGFVLKNSKLRAKAAKFVDPYKKKLKDLGSFEQSLVDSGRPRVVDNRSTGEKLQDATCPLARESYDDQLANKQNEVTTLIKRLGSDISRLSQPLKQWVTSRCDEFGGTLAQVDNFVRSPSTTGYRNKCEFSIGYMTKIEDSTTIKLESDLMETVEEESKKSEEMADVKEEAKDIEIKEEAKDIELKEEAKDSEEIQNVPEVEHTKVVSVGFRLASYKAGSVEVVSLASLGDDVCKLLPQISPEMVKVVTRFEKLVQVSTIPPYSSLDRSGNWRNLMLRTSRGSQEGVQEISQIMAVAVVDPQNLTSSAIDQLRSDLKDFFQPGGKGGGSDCGVTSLFIQLAPARRESGKSEPAPELLFGPTTIQETLLGRKFNISPQAFFQVNTLAAEVLYRTVGDVAELTKKTSLVDVCCGTGTIGICLADRAGQVVGVEIVQEAVRDAIRNAEINKVNNCKFFAGKAEDILSNILRDVDSKEVVAIVDPPRAGLHPRALAAIRNTPSIQRLVYVSCDAKNAMKNFVDLSRPPSKTAKGDPFLPTKIVPVDLFPHTRGFELVLLFERVPMGDILNGELNKRLTQVEKESVDDLVNLADQAKKEREEKSVVESVVSEGIDFLNNL